MSKNTKKIFLVEEEVYHPYREGGSIFPKKRGFLYTGDRGIKINYSPQILLILS
jgi:hypothetical protein